jgi:hypothetical protein
MNREPLRPLSHDSEYIKKSGYSHIGYLNRTFSMTQAEYPERSIMHLSRHGESAVNRALGFIRLDAALAYPALGAWLEY